MSLIVKEVGLRYGKKQILAPLSFTVEKSEIVTLFGPSGVGKTSLLKMIAGIQSVFSGELVFTEEFSQSETVLVFQNFSLFPHLTVWENIAFGLKVKKIKTAEISRKVAEMMTRFELNGLESRYPDQLSGGQQQRVALARAIVLQPKLLLLDEPFSSLDSHLKVAMRQYLLELKNDYDFGILLVTHDKDEAFYLSDRLVVIIDGKMQQVASPKDVYYHPSNRKVADFIGEVNYLQGHFEDGNFLIGNQLVEGLTTQNGNGPAELWVPFETEVAFNGRLTAQVTQITWQPSGNQVEFKLGNQYLKINGIREKLFVGQRVNLQLPRNLQVRS